MAAARLEVIGGGGMVGEGGEVLYRSARTEIVRVRGGAGSLIRKVCLGVDRTDRVRSERAILQRLSALPGVPRLADSDSSEPGAVLMVDTGHLSLDRFAAGGIPSGGWLVGFAREVARVLAGVHGAGVLHRDLSVANILVLPDGADPRLADYDLATTFVQERSEFTHPRELTGSLPYLSPESTGRTGRPVDQRADLYSFGAVLYELATGRPPFGFGSDDPLELVHAHLAQVPVPPGDICPGLPPVLSAIIVRLLEKEPDDRYASAEGLAHDLSRLAQACEPLAADFALGGKDFPARLTPPSRLVGRDGELAALAGAYEAVRAGGVRRGVLVGGPPGVGKSALLDHLRPLVTTSGEGWLVTGKFDQHRRDAHTDAVVQCLRGLGRLLLAEPEEAAEVHRDRLLAVLGRNAEHVAAVLPEFATLLRVRPERVAGDPGEVLRRSQRAFVQLLTAVASLARPVVMVLDDLQWASGLALGALDMMLTDDALRGVFVVGSFRDNEVALAHPLMGMVERWQMLGATGDITVLGNLPDAELGDFLGEMLRLPIGRARELAGVIIERAGGNPFDTVELLNGLRREGDLVLTEDGWDWDVAAIRKFIGGSDVLQLIEDRVARLPARTRELLQTVACLGGRAEVGLLEKVVQPGTGRAPEGSASSSGVGVSATGDCVPALDEGLLEVDRAGTPALRFRHRKVQEAVYASLGQGGACRRHLVLARVLARQGRAFEGEAAEQYLSALGELSHPGERREVVELFLRVAARASRIANHEVADRHLAAALDLLDATDCSSTQDVPTGDAPADDRDEWGNRDDWGGRGEAEALRLQVCVARHGALCGLRRFDAADEVFAWVNGRTDDGLVRARLAVVQLGSLTYRGMLGEAIGLGVEAMALLGHAVPEPAELDQAISDGLQRLRDWVAERPGGGSEIGGAGGVGGTGGTGGAGGVGEDGSECDDPRVKVVGQLMNRLVPAAHFAGDRRRLWFVTEAARLWDEYGPMPDLLGALAHGAFVTIPAAGDYRTGYDVVRWALAESARRGYEGAHAQALFLYSLSASPWFETPADTVRHCHQAREWLLSGGDLWNAGFTFMSSMGAVRTLAESEVEADAGLALIRRSGDRVTMAALEAYRRSVRTLQGRAERDDRSGDDAPEPGAEQNSPSGEAPSGEAPSGEAASGEAASGEAASGEAASEEAAGSVPVQVNRHAGGALEAAVAGDLESLDRHTAALMPLLPYVEGKAVSTHIRLYRALAVAQRVQAGERVEGGTWAELEECLAWLEARAQDCGANFAALRDFITAERAWASGELEQAAAWFDRACEGAAERWIPGNRPVIVERYARLRLAQGLDFDGRAVMRRARQLYREWGAEAKVSRLEEEFSFVGEGWDAPGGGDRHGDGRQGGPWQGSVTGAYQIDLVGILRAFQILSAETNPVRLQDRVAEVMGMLAGASQVRLVLRDPDNGGWSVPAEGSDGAPVMVPLGEAVAGGRVPIRLFRYVERTGETLVVEDALRDVRFAADPYFREVTRCSVMAVPITVRGGLRAVLVLENRLARGAFTARRLDVVQLIVGELGVCLDTMLVERFRSLVQGSGEVTMVCDRAGVVAYASAASVDLLGRAEQEVVGLRLPELFAVEDRPAMARGVSEVSAGKPLGLTVRVDAGGEDECWVDATLTDLTGEPAVSGVMVRLRDVTERRRLEIELRHAQKLESVGQLAAGIAHEINTPMQFITANLQFLTEAFAELADGAASDGVVSDGVESGGTAPGGSGSGGGGPAADLLAEIPEALAETVEGAERVVTIVRAMKAFGHPGGEAKNWVDLNEAIRNTLVVAANEIRPVADVVTDYAELPQVWCNLGDINQVVLNLVVNAAHAMAEKAAAGGGRGTLTVRTRAAGHVGDAGHSGHAGDSGHTGDPGDPGHTGDAGDAVEIDVEDTGAGIPAEIAERVFDQFFTTKEVGRGTGQGLALARTLVHDRHRGTLTFTSEPGAGTTFTVRLPRGDG